MFLSKIAYHLYMHSESLSVLWTFAQRLVSSSVVKNIDISISIDTEISERYQY